MIKESSLLRSLSAASRYSARDIADLLLLYSIALHILRCDFEAAPFAQDYARHTISYHDWNHVRLSNTDLYQLLNILMAQQAEWTNRLKNHKASDLLLRDIYLDPVDVRQFLQNISKGGFNPTQSGRMLLHFEQDLRTEVSNYRSMRRIAADWTKSHVTTEDKSLVVTRLLQAMRHKALQGDLLRALEDLARRQQLELKDVCNPETGGNCGAAPTALAPVGAKPPSLLKQLAVGAGLGVGAYLLGKAIFGRDHK
jgi:hypothetical protein